MTVVEPEGPKDLPLYIRGQPKARTTFPLVAATMWCGEFRPPTPKENEVARAERLAASEAELARLDGLDFSGL